MDKEEKNNKINGEESSIWHVADEITAKPVPKGTDSKEDLEEIFRDIPNNFAHEGAAPEKTATEGPEAAGHAIEGSVHEESGYDEKTKISSGFNIFSSLFSRLSISGDVIKGMIPGFFGKFASISEKLKKVFAPLVNLLEKISGKFPGVRERCLSVVGIVKGLKGKVPSIKDKDLIKVFGNPWVIANGVVLIVALSMTAVIVSWVKTRTSAINSALTNLTQLQSAPKDDESGLSPGKVTVQPFIVKEETLTEGKKDMGGADKGQKMDKDFESLSESAEQSFSKGEYQKALAFYSALVSDKYDVKDKGFLNLRIGECYFYSGLYNEAIEALNSVIHEKGGDQESKWHSRYLLAECYMKLGNFDNGRKTLYALIALGGDITPGMTELIERSYFRIAESYMEEAQASLGLTISD